MLKKWLVVIALMAQTASAIELDQVDTFQDETTNNWTMGRPGDFHELTQTVRHEFDCGESGTGDSCLRVFATGADGAGSRLATFNLDQWTGNYLAAGVAGIRLRAKNFSSSPQSVRLRIMLVGDGYKFISKDSIAVPFNNAFNEGLIRLSPETLSATSLEQANALLRNVEQIWILHHAEPNLIIPPIQARVYIDDIQAVSDGDSVLVNDFDSVDSP